MLKNLYTGRKLKGRITSVHSYGAFLDCDVYIKDQDNRYKKILALLHKNKLTLNVGLSSDTSTEKENKELILQKNMNIIVYVDKIIKRELPPENNFIFFNLTLDSSITEEKINWLQNLKFKKDSINQQILLNNQKVKQENKTDMNQIHNNYDNKIDNNHNNNLIVQCKSNNHNILEPSYKNENEIRNNQMTYIDNQNVENFYQKDNKNKQKKKI
nr:conserved Plasmodium protein, unknown function [Plasmodium sp. DRC-Itaito]